jgi:hypothetical protein
MKRDIRQLYNPTKYFAFQCPRCGSSIPYLDVRIDFGIGFTTTPFECRSCKAVLSVSRRYIWAVFVSMVILSLIVPTIFRVHPWWLFLLAVLLCSQIVGQLTGLYAKWLFPPRLELGPNDNSFLRLFDS